MHLDYQALIQADPELESRLMWLPGAVFSGRKRVARGARGVFLCYALPALDKEAGEFTEAAGSTRWYLYDLDRDAILEEPGEIVTSIRATPNNTPQMRYGGEDAYRNPLKDRKTHQEHLSQANRCSGRRQGLTEVLDGIERWLSQC